jgi:hypothetical protein
VIGLYPEPAAALIRREKFPPARYYRRRRRRTEYPMTQAMSRVALYAAVGPELTHYEVDVAAGTLTRRGDVQLPANVQYAWPHASGHLLYAGCSNAATGHGIVGSDYSH